MSEKAKKLAILLCVYILIFWVGFKSGEVYNRMKNKIKIERILIKQAPQTKIRSFWIVEKHADSSVTFEDVMEGHPVIKFFLNKNLRPLLKLRNLKIYTHSGKRIY